MNEHIPPNLQFKWKGGKIHCRGYNCDFVASTKKEWIAHKEEVHQDMQWEEEITIHDSNESRINADLPYEI